MEYAPEKTAAYLAGSIDKFVKQPARDTIMQNVKADRFARYARIPDGKACDFCQMLGSRGFVYHSKEKAGGGGGHGSKYDTFHPFCNCQIAVSFDPAMQFYYVGWTKVSRGYAKDGRVVATGHDKSHRLRDIDIDELFEQYKAAGNSYVSGSRYRDYMGHKVSKLTNKQLFAYQDMLEGAATIEELEQIKVFIDSDWNPRGVRDSKQTAALRRIAARREHELINESERVYGIPYNNAMVVSETMLESEEYASKFLGITGDPKIDNKILEAAKHALKTNSGKNTESLTLIDITNGKSVTIDCNIEYGIEYNEEIIAFIAERKDKPSVIVAVHNHPNGTPPSLDDFSKASENNYLLGVIAGHNGQVYTYLNFGKNYTDKQCDSFNDLIVGYVEGGGDIDRICTEVFASEGLKYELR